MKVLILGASGFVGSAVARAFVRAGHIVYGQTRSAASGARLGAEEVLPVVCDPFAEPEKWKQVAADVDVLVDALAAGGAPRALAVFAAFLAAVAHRDEIEPGEEHPDEHGDEHRGEPREESGEEHQGGSGQPLPAYIYCSGHYVMARGGGGLAHWTDERRPARAAANRGAGWRRAVEDAVLSSRAVNGAVIRPTCLYGRGGSYFAEYHFRPALAALARGVRTFDSIVPKDGKIATVHTDDCAALFVAVAERGPTCRGQVFVASNPATDNVRDVLDGIVRITGLEVWKAGEPVDEFENAWITPVLQKPTLGHALTGWAPRKMGLSDGIDVYWSAFVHSEKARDSEFIAVVDSCIRCDAHN